MADVSARIDQARSLIRSGDPDAALAILTRAARADPANPDVLDLLCFLHCERGELEKAVAYGERAVSCAPTRADFRVNLGMSLLGLDRFDEAIETLWAGVHAEPAHIAVRYTLCLALALARRWNAAIAEARAGLDRFPAHAGFAARLAHALGQTGRATEGARALQAALARNPDDLALATDLCGIATYAGGLTAQEAFDAHRRYGALLERIVPPHPAGPARTDTANPERRLRVGFVSSDLRFHPVAVFLKPLLKHVRRDAVETYCYATAGKGDAVTARLRAHAGVFRAVPNIKTTELAELVRKDKIDILFDLAGHTSGHALPTFQMRAAPVQATWMGFPNTTGLRSIDYRITDAITDPALKGTAPGQAPADALATERLWRLDPCFLCYTPPTESHAEGPGAVVPEPAAVAPCEASGSGGFTFGCFNSIAKLDDGVIELWAKILGAAPGSRLLLKHTALKEEDGREIVRERIAPALAREGVAMERLALEGPEPFLKFLGAYTRVDVALDPFPFGGATTTCDALFMGVPVLTLRGDRTAARVCASILTNVGMTGCIAESKEEYFRIAVGLAATGGGGLARLRAGLRERLLGSPVCDAPGFARRFEQMVRAWWRDHCARAGK